MGTILLYRNDGDRPHCEVALDNGDRVLLTLDANGAEIKRQGTDDKLFSASPDVVADLCAAILDDQPASKTTPLDTLLLVVTRMPSSEDLRRAFHDAAKQAARFR